MNLDKKRITVGILAHVDAGKTTLAESILYLTGTLRKLGRVDHQDAFLDNFSLERERGITIFSKQARVQSGSMELTLVDTPGHVDFSAEMERTLQILDYAILVISGADGVQSHVETLWRLLARYQIPVFLFVNKMDQPGTERDQLQMELQKRLSEHCVDFTDTTGDAWKESVALCEESLLESFLDTGTVTEKTAAELIRNRKVFPCFYGSALKLRGIEELLEGMERFTQKPMYGDSFSARVYKISRDEQGNRLTHMKITGGSLKVKTALSNRGQSHLNEKDTHNDSDEIWVEKVNQIRLYSGAGFTAVNEAEAGMVCALTGLSHTHAGEGLGNETQAELPLLEPVLSYQICLPEGCDVHQVFRSLRMLEEEEPELHMVWNAQNNEIYAQLMGEVQIEVLRSMIRERFSLEVEFGPGSIVYKETIANSVIGLGHFEPLRHYAEVHLLLEPGERGSGLQFGTVCSEDVLALNWQRLILTHLEEKKHLGVLTGSEVTDLHITLITGKAHQKHTEGGDFRQATYRAVRQGLMQAESILLEPVYQFRMEIPGECAGRAMHDLQKMSGTFAGPEMEGEFAVLTGRVPVVTMRGYQTELLSYTKGRGRLFVSLGGYEPCHNQEEILSRCEYDPLTDAENPTGSVFCAHGAGFVVDWDMVPEYIHLEISKNTEKSEPENEERKHRMDVPHQRAGVENAQRTISQEEIDEIMTRTYGTAGREAAAWKRSRRTDFGTQAPATPSKKPPMEEYLLVDGYNILFAWEELNELAKVNMDSARTRLMDILCNYQGYRKMNVILVFEAYRVEGGQGSVQQYHNIYVVYTKEAETADQYIEKTVHEIGKKYQVTVATSDALEQIIILGQGGHRMSAKGLLEEIQRMEQELRSDYLKPEKNGKQYLFDGLSEETRKAIEQMHSKE